MNARGITDQWGTGPVSARPHVVEEIAALAPSGLVATGAAIVGFVAANADVPEWFADVVGNDVAGACLYLHTIVGSRASEARGVGAALLLHVASLAVAEGRRYLVQNGFANNPELLRYYETVGFSRYGPATDSGQPMVMNLDGDR